MFILNFETISEYVSISILKNDVLIDSLIYKKNVAQAETILISIELILSRNKMKYSDIDLFSVIVGPSSFIKIRIGLSIAYALQFTTEKKVVGVNLFEIYNNIAKNISNLEESIIILNAYQDNFYVRYIDNNNVIDDFVNIDQISSLIQNNRNVFCDSKSFDKLKVFHVGSIIDISKQINNLSVESGLLVQKNIKEGLIDLENIDNPKPFYLLNPVFKKKSR